MRCRKQIVAWGLVVCMVICTVIWHIPGIKVQAETTNGEEQSFIVDFGDGDTKLKFVCDKTHVKVGDVVNIMVINQSATNQISYMHSSFGYNMSKISISKTTTYYDSWKDQSSYGEWTCDGEGSYVQSGETIATIQFKMTDEFVKEKFTLYYMECVVTSKTDSIYAGGNGDLNTFTFLMNDVTPQYPNGSENEDEQSFIVDFGDGDTKVKFVCDKTHVKVGDVINISGINQSNTRRISGINTMMLDTCDVSWGHVSTELEGWGGIAQCFNEDEVEGWSIYNGYGYIFLEAFGYPGTAAPGDTLFTWQIELTKEIETINFLSFECFDYNNSNSYEVGEVPSTILQSFTFIMNDGSSAESTNATTTHVKDYTETVEGFYRDYNYTQPASKGAIEIYANGKKNYKSDVLYTDITPCYVYTEEKGKIKTSTSKIVTAVTASDKEPAISKSKITTTKADTDIAKATIKNGQITVTAGKNGGIGYLWVANVTAPDKAKKMISIPVNVKVAPTKIETYNRADKNVTLGTTPKYTTGELQLIGRTYVYLYPYAKVNNVNTETIDSISFTATVAKNATDYIRVEKTNDPFVFMVEGYALKNGKKVSGNVTFTCDQSGKKVNFKATVKDMILDFTYQPQESTKLIKTTVDSVTEAYKVIGVSTAAITSKLDVKSRTFFERGRETYGVLPTTDSVYLTKISKDTAIALSKNVRSYDDANDGIDVPVKKNGKPDVTADTTKGVTASYSKGVITVKVAKKTEVGTTAYFLLSTNSGYGEIIAVTTAEQ